MLAGSKQKQVAGESGLASDAFHLCRREAAALLHPLLTKSMANADAPLQWKDAQLVTSYRDIATTEREAKVNGNV